MPSNAGVYQGPAGKEAGQDSSDSELHRATTVIYKSHSEANWKVQGERHDLETISKVFRYRR